MAATNENPAGAIGASGDSVHAAKLNRPGYTQSPAIREIIAKLVGGLR